MEDLWARKKKKTHSKSGSRLLSHLLFMTYNSVNSNVVWPVCVLR